MSDAISGNVDQQTRTYCEVLRARAAQEPSRTAFEFTAADGEVTGQLSYADLDQQARTVAAALGDRAGPGERVLLVFPPGLAYIAALFGCFYAGMVAVPAYPPRAHRGFERLRSIVADAAAGIALTNESTLTRMERLTDHQLDLGSAQVLTTDQLPPELAGRWTPPGGTGEELAILQYTSGSTGTPRGVMLSHANLLSNSAAITSVFDLDRDSRAVSWLPPYHDMGLIGGILQPVFAGFPMRHLSPTTFVQEPMAWLTAISQTRATISAGPDFAYAWCAELATPEQRAALDLSCWRAAVIGSEPVRPQTLDRFAGAFAESGFRRSALRPAYGLAEATLLVSGVGDDSAPRIARSARCIACGTPPPCCCARRTR